MSKPEEAPYLAWIDLETTGTDEQKDQIVEVGLVVTDRDLNPVLTYASVVDLDDLNDLAQMDPVVIDMHTRSGLVRDLILGGDIDIEEVDTQVSTRLLNLAGGRHIPFAGSGVLHFDRRFIRRYMPLTDKRLSYWAYDVGVLRRFLRLSGYPIPTDYNLNHRALDDVRAHIAEARQYLDLLGGLEVPQ